MKQCVDCKQKYPDNLSVCPKDGQPLLGGDGSAKSDPLIGKLIMEKYRIERLIGRGGMGGVYEGRHLALDRQVAIKMMNPQIVSDKTAVARFIREARATAKLDHPNAVTIHDFGVLEDTGVFIVMEFIGGKSLRKILSTSGALSLDQALEWFTPVCEVLEAAHKHGIIHRDLKPENIMLKEAPEGLIVKVVDFGLAKLNTGENGNSAKLTKTGEVMGTPQYMAPELYEGETADPRSDIYALGIIFYEMITGSAPFTGSFENVIAGHLFKEPKPVAKVNPAITVDIDDTIKLALKKNRDERIGSAVEFAALLKSAAGLDRQINRQAASQRPIDSADIRPSSPKQFRVSQQTSAIRTDQKPTTTINGLHVLPKPPETLPAHSPRETAIFTLAKPGAVTTTVESTAAANRVQPAATLPQRLIWLAVITVGAALFVWLSLYFFYWSPNPEPAREPSPKPVAGPTPTSQPNPHSVGPAGKRKEKTKR